MSGTRTNEKLENLPNAISVMTADLLADLGALNFLDAADFAVGAENVFNDGATRGATTLTNFYPLLTARFAEAIATAKARGLNPDTTFPFTEQYLEDAADNAPGTRHSMSFTGRYSFTEGVVKGLALGCNARFQQGKPIGGISVAGVNVIPAKQTDDTYVFSPFATYRKKFRHTTWTAQVNVQNVFNRVSYQGNNYRNNRLTDPRQYVFSNSFGF